MLSPLEFTLEMALHCVSESKLRLSLSGEFHIVPAVDGVFQEASGGERYWRESPEINDALFECLGLSREEYIAVWHSVSLGLENAFWRGNKSDPTLPVDVRAYRCRLGKVVQIQDFGEGFDYEKKIRDFLSGRPYAQGKGTGFRALHQEKLIKAGYEGEGNILNIAVLIPEDASDYF